MVMLTYCIACSYGQHDSHIEDFDPAPEGVLGGARCPCEGECAESYQPSVPRQATAEEQAQALSDDEWLRALFLSMRAGRQP